MNDVPFDFGFFERFSVPLKRYATGAKISEQGQDGRCMYVILEGKVDIIVNGTLLETVGLHDIFGEMALIDHAPRSADSVAAAGTEVAVIDEDAFLKLVSSSPRFSLYVMRQMANRIRRMNERL